MMERNTPEKDAPGVSDRVYLPPDSKYARAYLPSDTKWADTKGNHEAQMNRALENRVALSVVHEYEKISPPVQSSDQSSVQSSYFAIARGSSQKQSSDLSNEQKRKADALNSEFYFYEVANSVFALTRSPNTLRAEQRCCW